MDSKTSYAIWSCNHCPAFHFGDAESVRPTAREHSQVHGHSMKARLVENGEVKSEKFWGVPEALLRGTITAAGDFVKG